MNQFTMLTTGSVCAAKHQPILFQVSLGPKENLCKLLL